MSKEYIINYSIIENDENHNMIDELKGKQIIVADSIKDIEDNILSKLNKTEEDKTFELNLTCSINTEDNTIESIFDKKIYLSGDSIMECMLMVHSTIIRNNKKEIKLDV